MPARPSATPRPWRSARRAASEAAHSPSALTFATAWTAPTRRTGSLAGVVSAQSLRPLAAVGTAARMPVAMRRLAAGRPAGAPPAAGTPADGHAPIGGALGDGGRPGPRGGPPRPPLA